MIPMPGNAVVKPFQLPVKILIANIW
jgi:hypothetical protein